MKNQTVSPAGLRAAANSPWSQPSAAEIAAEIAFFEQQDLEQHEHDLWLESVAS